MSKIAIVTVALDTAIVRGETSIASVQVRKPATGEMRGLKLAEVLAGDVNAMITLLPRVTNPPLIEAEVAGMDSADFIECVNQVAAFFQQTGPNTDSPTA